MVKYKIIWIQCKYCGNKMKYIGKINGRKLCVYCGKGINVKNSITTRNLENEI